MFEVQTLSNSNFSEYLSSSFPLM